MLHKVFFVEDEIVTREGIRDHVDWRGNGFEFCGEAADGETALPLLQALQPDVLITDIKMPFMDGLQLCRIVRERMPAMKTIILSGHDEFEYAREAIKLGVTEYLLKPVTAQDLHHVLQRVAAQLEQEEREQDALRKLRDQVEENRITLKERLLLRLITGAVSPAEAIERGQQLGLDLVARCYLVVVIKICPANPADPFDYAEYQRAQQVVASSAEHNPDAFVLKKDMEELVLIMKGSTLEYLEEERDLFLEKAQREVRKTCCRLTIGAGSPKARIADIPQSFVEAVIVAHGGPAARDGVDKAALLGGDRPAVEDYLKRGVKEDFDGFFEAFIRPFSAEVFQSHIVKSYVFMDVALTTARFVHEMGGDVDQIIPELNHLEAVLTSVQTTAQIREHIRKILVAALGFRDSRANRHYTGMLRQAKDYIDRHYMDLNISLNEVAAHVNHSASHFSTVFSQETGCTFKEYLTEIRIRRAKELLRTTPLRSADIAYEVGYNDPHYFSYVFRKNTGLTPSEFRQQAQTGCRKNAAPAGSELRLQTQPG